MSDRVVKATVQSKEERAAVLARAVQRLTRLNLPPLYRH